MTCDKCDKFQDEGNGYYYRWGRSNVFIGACEEHFREIREVLNKVQREPTNEEVEK